MIRPLSTLSGWVTDWKAARPTTASAGNGSRSLEGLIGFSVYTALLATAAYILPPVTQHANGQGFMFVVGGLAAWRYSWGLFHFARSIVYRRLVFPRLRMKAEANIHNLLPSHIYLLVTSFRIEAKTSIRVYNAAINEATHCGVPATIVASIVELADEFLVTELFKQANPPEHVRLQIVRIPGTGKRDGLAQGFRAISRDMPAEDSVVAVIDGDSILDAGILRKTVPFFKMMPKLGALTTDEECDVQGSRVIREWHHLRFAQRHILMSSMALSRRVLTLTGRMSLFRSEIITHPDFIRHVEADAIDHWRLGKFRFLTGDDKSSWFWVLKNDYDMLYVPDAMTHTVEHPPSENFFAATTMLMFRWFGNMLRTNGRALRLGPGKMGFFTWWCIFDQRISMWTSMSGPLFAMLLTLKYSGAFIAVYAVWVGFTRWVMSLMLLTSRPILSWHYPFLIYYNQIWGALIKTYVFFRLDRQSWTRQKTKLERGLSMDEQRMVSVSSAAVHTVAILCFVATIGTLCGVFSFELP